MSFTTRNLIFIDNSLNITDDTKVCPFWNIDQTLNVFH